MRVQKETEKAYLMGHYEVDFWIQKRFLKPDGTLTPAGWKAYHIAKRKQSQHFGFDAMKEFEFVQETEKAVLLRCTVKLGSGIGDFYNMVTQEEFWLPKTMLGNFDFVSKKIGEVEAKFPFVGTYVKWSGRTLPKQETRGNV